MFSAILNECSLQSLVRTGAGLREYAPTYEGGYPADPGSLSLFSLEGCLASEGSLTLRAQCVLLQINLNLIAGRCANSSVQTCCY